MLVQLPATEETSILSPMGGRKKILMPIRKLKPKNLRKQQYLKEKHNNVVNIGL